MPEINTIPSSSTCHVCFMESSFFFIWMYYALRDHAAVGVLTAKKVPIIFGKRGIKTSSRFILREFHKIGRLMKKGNMLSKSCFIANLFLFVFLLIILTNLWKKFKKYWKFKGVSNISLSLRMYILLLSPCLM